MPRKKHEKENNGNKYQGGGQSAPLSTVMLDTSRTAALEKELAGQKERLITRRDAADEAKFLLHDAQRHYDTIEARYLAGRVDQRMLDDARAKLDAAKQRHAEASVSCEEAERLAHDVLPKAIAEAQQAALIAFRDAVRAEVQAQGRELAQHLAAAKQASDALRALHDAAEEHFPRLQLLRLKVSLLGAYDAGEEGGFIGPVADVPDLACPYLTGRTPNQPTMYSQWQKELAAFLAKSPAEMAEADRQRRAAILAQDERSYRESLRREAAQKQLEAMMEARVFGTPLGAEIGAENIPAD